MRVVCWLLLLACLAVPQVPASPRAEAACLPLTVTNDDGNYIVPGARGGVVYRRVDEQELRLDFWVPSTSPHQPRGSNRSVVAPVVIVIHGGGFTAGSRVTFVGQFLELLAAAGYPWVSIDYRLGEPSRAANAADDVEAAVAFTRCHAGELGIDPERIVLLGEDAGAGLAARIANRRRAGVVGAILIGGLYNGVPPQAEPPREGPSRPRAAPRFLVVHGTADTQVPLREAEAWCGPAVTDDARCKLLRVEGASHRAENWWPVQWDYKAQVVRWLDDLAPAGRQDTLQPPPVDGNTMLPAGLHKRIPYAQQESSASPPSPHSGSTGPVLRTLDAWLPRDRSRPGPAVVLLHGGGWEAGDRVTYITPLFAPLAEAGLAWFSLDYRLTPAVHHPRQLDDLREAIAFIRRHAHQFGIDPARVVLVGESASAQMVTLVATEDRTLAGVVSFYGVYDFVPMVTDAEPRSLAARLFGRTVLDDDTGRILREYSPLHRAARGMPPILLIHGTGERLWEQGVRMAERLGTLGVPHELIRLEGAPHGMENWEGRPEWQFYKARLVSWIQQAAAHQRR
jgi:acetyl esterase